MFRTQRIQSRRNVRLAIAALLMLSVCSLFISLWFVVDFGREQDIVKQLVRDLPARDLPVAEELANELQWQSRWTFLVILQVVATGLAIWVLFRAYLGSQERLNDIKALAGDILSSMEQAVITSDNDGLVTSLNGRAIEFFNLVGDPVGKSLPQMTAQIDLAKIRTEAESQSGHSLVKDYLVKNAGESLWLRTFCQPLRDSGGQLIGNVFQLRDVTADRHLQERAGRMERFMGLGSLAVGLHHEIKNPLAAVSLHVQLVEEALAEQSVPEDVSEMLSIIKSEMRRISQVLESFRDYASAGKLDLINTNLADLLTRQVSLFRPSAKESRVNIELSLCVDLPKQITIDAARIEQIVHNLMLNAIQAMPDGGTLSISVKPTREADVDGVVMRFTDTGGGIPENIRPHIFDAYFTTKGSGTGMGLALSDKIARQHGGRLDLASVDHGATFELFLPNSPIGQTT